MTVDAKTTPRTGPATWLSIRIAATLIAAGGRMTDAKALQLAEETVGRRPEQRLKYALRVMVDDEVIVHVDGVWYAPNVADLGAWLADALEAHDDAGRLFNPCIPRARSAA